MCLWFVVCVCVCVCVFVLELFDICNQYQMQRKNKNAQTKIKAYQRFAEATALSIVFKIIQKKCKQEMARVGVNVHALSLCLYVWKLVFSLILPIN